MERIISLFTSINTFPVYIVFLVLAIFVGLYIYDYFDTEKVENAMENSSEEETSKKALYSHPDASAVFSSLEVRPVTGVFVEGLAVTRDLIKLEKSEIFTGKGCFKVVKGSITVYLERDQQGEILTDASSSTNESVQENSLAVFGNSRGHDIYEMSETYDFYENEIAYNTDRADEVLPEEKNTFDGNRTIVARFTEGMVFTSIGFYDLTENLHLTYKADSQTEMMFLNFTKDFSSIKSKIRKKLTRIARNLFPSVQKHELMTILKYFFISCEYYRTNKIIRKKNFIYLTNTTCLGLENFLYGTDVAQDLHHTEPHVIDFFGIQKVTLAALLADVPRLYKDLFTFFRHPQEIKRIVLVTGNNIEGFSFNLLRAIRKIKSCSLVGVFDINEFIARHFHETVHPLLVIDFLISSYIDTLNSTYVLISLDFSDSKSKMYIELIKATCHKKFVVLDMKHCPVTSEFQTFETVRLCCKLELPFFDYGQKSRLAQAIERLRLLAALIVPLNGIFRKVDVSSIGRIFSTSHNIFAADHKIYDLTDYGRLARYLTGTRIGLVLGGGGARGFAHIGVIKALTEENIQIDIIGGTSMGAFIGALYSATMDVIKVYIAAKKFAKDICFFPFILFDITFPYVSFFAGNVLNSTLTKCFSNLRLDSLWIPFYCCVTDLGNACGRIYTSGPLKILVRASMSITSFLPPVLYSNKLLVDGAYTNNVPWSYLTNPSLGVHTIIAVNVCSKDSLGAKNKIYYDNNSSYSWSGLWLVFKRYFFMNDTILSSADIQTELVFLIDKNRFKEKPLSDLFLLIEPDLSKFSGFSFKHIDEIVLLGYETTKRELFKWKLRVRSSRRKITRRRTL